MEYSKLDDIFREVEKELERATKKFGPIRTTHEGYGVILEELDEAWDEIKHNNAKLACEEMKQVAAMAIRFIYDLRA